MATLRITERVIGALPTPRKGKQSIVRDASLVGFGVRKTATGCTSFFLNYVADGAERRITIGRHPSWSVTAAREEASRLRRIVDTGGNPLLERQAKRVEQTLQSFWTGYDEHAVARKAPKTQTEERSLWRRLILPDLGRLRLSAVRQPSAQTHCLSTKDVSGLGKLAATVLP